MLNSTDQKQRANTKPFPLLEKKQKSGQKSKSGH